jgi:hypothetical protein
MHDNVFKHHNVFKHYKSLISGPVCQTEVLRMRLNFLFIYLFIKDTCMAHYPRVSSKRFTFTPLPAVGRCGYEIKGPSCLEPQELSLVPLFCHALFVFSDSSILCL